jgi:hypothetical protein
MESSDQNFSIGEHGDCGEICGATESLSKLFLKWVKMLVKNYARIKGS